MRKIVFIIFLFLLDFIAYRYLIKTGEEGKAYQIKFAQQSFLYQKKDLIFNDIDDFVFAEYFGVIGSEKGKFLYRFDEDDLMISIDSQEFTYPYKIIVNEPVIVEKTVIKEVPVIIHDHSQNESDKPADTPEIKKPDKEKPDKEDEPVKEPQLDIDCKTFRFPVGTDLDEILKQIRKSIISNDSVYIEYSELNPDVEGTYELIIANNYVSESVYVEIS